MRFRSCCSPRRSPDDPSVLLPSKDGFAENVSPEPPGSVKWVWCIRAATGSVAFGDAAAALESNWMPWRSASWSGVILRPSPWPVFFRPSSAAGGRFRRFLILRGWAPGSCSYPVSDGLPGAYRVRRHHAPPMRDPAVRRGPDTGVDLLVVTLVLLIRDAHAGGPIFDDGRGLLVVIDGSRSRWSAGSSSRPCSTDGIWLSGRSASRWLCSPGAGPSEPVDFTVCVGAILWEREAPTETVIESQTAVPAER